MAQRLKTNQEMIEQHLEEIGANEFERRAAMASLRVHGLRSALRVVHSFREWRQPEQQCLFALQGGVAR